MLLLANAAALTHNARSMKGRVWIMRVGFTLAIAGVLATGSLVGSAATGPTPSPVLSAAAADVLITEAQTASTGSGSEEFVELYNATDHDIDLADAGNSGKDAWKLQYFLGSKFDAVRADPAAAAWLSPTGSVVLTGTIAAHAYYLLASVAGSADYMPASIEADQHYSPHLSDNVALQLVDTPSPSSTVWHDRLAWSDDSAKQGGPLNVMAAPVAGGSLQRLTADDGSYTNADGSFTAFTTDTAISPKAAWLPPAPDPVPDPVPDPSSAPSSDPASGGATDTGMSDIDGSAPGSDPAPSDSGTVTPPAVPNAGLLVPVITELLPNPASPATDGQDEFIELFNPNSSSFNLKGYTLQTGTTTLHNFTFTSDTLLAPGGYQIFTSAETGLALSNSGSQARLLDGGSAVLSQTGGYDTAAEGTAWALDDASGAWQWTTTPSPGAPNIFTDVQAATTSTKTTAASAAKTTAKATAAKAVKVSGTRSVTTKAAKTTKAKAAKPKAAKKATTKLTSASAQQPLTTPIHPWTLAVIAILALAYGIYEYRHDLANRFYQFRKHREAGRRLRFTTQGR